MSRPRRCECFWEKCGEAIAQTAVFENALGKLDRLGLCRPHMRQYVDPAFRAGLAERAMAAWRGLGAKADPLQMAEHPAQAALIAHQAACVPCGEVRDWVVGESLAGRAETRADRDRIGEYIIANACPEGVELNERVGRAMLGLE